MEERQPKGTCSYEGEEPEIEVEVEQILGSDDPVLAGIAKDMVQRTHEQELREFQEWKLSQMSPLARRAEQLKEEFKQATLQGRLDRFWMHVARELEIGDRHRETVETFKRIIGALTSLQANIETFKTAMEVSFTEDDGKAEPEERNGEDPQG